MERKHKRAERLAANAKHRVPIKDKNREWQYNATLKALKEVEKYNSVDVY